MTLTRKEIGERGEYLAARYLERRGYQVVERNFRFQRAEIDLICRRNAGGVRELVFVEVKTRSSFRYGRPEEAVGWRKRQHLWRAAEGYVLTRRLTDTRMRFDVISIKYSDGNARIYHIKDAFS